MVRWAAGRRLYQACPQYDLTHPVAQLPIAGGFARDRLPSSLTLGPTISLTDRDVLSKPCHPRGCSPPREQRELEWMATSGTSPLGVPPALPGWQ